MAYPPRPDQFEVLDFSNATNYCAAQAPSRDAEFLPYWRFWQDAWRSSFDFDFFTSHTAFEEEDDDTWQPSRFLGSGAFGVVGGWIKKDEEGEVVDEIAIKEIHSSTIKKDHPQNYGRRLKNLLWDPPAAADASPQDKDDGLIPDQSEDLLNEAVIQRQLNLALCDNIIHLRGFKYFRRDQASRPAKSWRFYQELAPYGTLDGLLCRYRYYKQHLPEYFLWHVAHSLLECAEVMIQCSHDNLPPRSSRLNKTDQVVNFDIKSSNIFVGYAERRKDSSRHGGTKKYDYPVIKMGDFGLSYFTGEHDVSNPGLYWGPGTAYCRPPEQVNYGMYWQEPPNGPYLGLHNHITPETSVQILKDMTLPPDGFDYRDSQNFCFKFSEKVHVWAIGMVLYELMSLSDPHDYWNISAASWYAFLENGAKQIPDFSEEPFRKYDKEKQSPYSAALTNFVDDCMRTDESIRPEVRKMKEKARARIQLHDNAWSEDCEETNKGLATRGVQHPKLYWRPSEINDMPEGQEIYPQTMDDFRAMKDCQNYDPDWPVNPNFHAKKGISTDDLLKHATNHIEAWGMLKVRMKKRLNDAFSLGKDRDGNWYIIKKRTKSPPHGSSQPPGNNDDGADDNHEHRKPGPGGSAPPDPTAQRTPIVQAARKAPTRPQTTIGNVRVSRLSRLRRSGAHNGKSATESFLRALASQALKGLGIGQQPDNPNPPGGPNNNNDPTPPVGPSNIPNPAGLDNPIPRHSSSGSRPLSKSLRSRKIHYKKGDIKPGQKKAASGPPKQKQAAKPRKATAGTQSNVQRRTTKKSTRKNRRPPALTLSQISSPTSSLSPVPSDLDRGSSPLLSPINPSVIPPTLWAPRFTIAHAFAVNQLPPLPPNALPPLPPDAHPADRSFHWDAQQGHYVRDQAGVMYYWQWRPRPYQLNRGEWIEVEVWPDTAQNRRLERVGLPRIRGG